MADWWHERAEGRQWKEKDRSKDDWKTRSDNGGWEATEWHQQSASSRSDEWRGYGEETDVAWNTERGRSEQNRGAVTLKAASKSEESWSTVQEES